MKTPNIGEATKSPFIKTAIALRNIANHPNTSKDDHDTLMHHNTLLKSHNPEHHKASANKASRHDSHIRDIVSDAIHKHSSKAASAAWHKHAGITRLREEAPATSIGNASVALPPTAMFKPVDVTDKRHKKDKPPVILKRFRKFFGET